MSLFKRPKSAFWWTEFVFRGHRVRRSTETASRREAQAVARKIRDDFELEAKARGKAPPKRKSPLTLDQACGKYWADHGCRLKDARNEMRNLNYIRQVIGGDTPFGEISNKHVDELKNARINMGAGPAGTNRTITTLRTMHNRAAKSWEEPVRVIDWKRHKLKEPKNRVRYLTIGQAKLLLDTLEAFAPHIAFVVRFLLLTGLRKSEAFGATWDKYNAHSATLTALVKGGYEREVPLNGEVVELLRDIPRTGRYIFDTTNARKHFERALRELKIEDFHWHDLRHTHATWLGQSGASIEVISQSLGHSGLAVTMKYRHVAHREVRAALQELPTLGSPHSNVVTLKRDLSD
jgi:integrase